MVTDSTLRRVETCSVQDCEEPSVARFRINFVNFDTKLPVEDEIIFYGCFRHAAEMMAQNYTDE